MPRDFDKLIPRFTKFIQAQKLFFVATADREGRVNLSPKGLDTLRVLADDRIVWLSLSGSGNETAAHLKYHDRITMMFCAFEGEALTLRVYGQGRVVHPGDADWAELSGLFEQMGGARQVIDVTVDLVKTSCGTGVPVMEYSHQRGTTELEPFYAEMNDEQLKNFWTRKNVVSIDGKQTGIFWSMTTLVEKALEEKALAFKRLHERDGVFVMPNAWDAGSAKFLEAAGFEAIATTSGGVNWAKGRRDWVLEVPRDEMLDIYGEAAGAVDVPVSGDLENGYGDEPEEVAATITGAVARGMVGGGIEDWTANPKQPLYEKSLAVERIRAARQAGDATGITFTLTARCEVFCTDLPQAYVQAVDRCNRFVEAGADCLFVPGLAGRDNIKNFVRDVDAPLSMVAGLAEPRLSVAELGDLGVRRISTGASLFRACFGLLKQAAEELHGSGSFGYLDGAIPDPHIDAFFRDGKHVE